MCLTNTCGENSLCTCTHGRDDFEQVSVFQLCTQRRFGDKSASNILRAISGGRHLKGRKGSFEEAGFVNSARLTTHVRIELARLTESGYGDLGPMRILPIIHDLSNDDLYVTEADPRSHHSPSLGAVGSRVPFSSCRGASGPNSDSRAILTMLNRSVL